jgi:hypothetical protein
MRGATSKKMATLKNIILELESSTGIRIYVNGQSRYQTNWNYYDSLAKMLSINYDSYMEALTDLLNWAKATWEELKDGIFGWNCPRIMMANIPHVMKQLTPEQIGGF